MELFGGMPDAVKFIIVFLLILGLLVPLLWRRFNLSPLSHGNPRGRPRLSVIETAAVDGRHRLFLVKRDNVEHLLLVGGASNIIVEANIARPSQAARDPRPIPDARAEPARQQQQQPAAAADAPDWSSVPLEQMARPVRTVDLDAALPEPPARTAREAMVDSMRAVRSVAAARRGPPMDLDRPPEEIAAPALTPSPAPAEVSHRPAPELRRAAPEPQRPQPVAPEPVPPSNDAEPKRERMAPPERVAPPERAAPAAPRPVQPAGAAASANAVPRQVQPAPNAPPPRPVQPVPAAANPAPPPSRQPAPSSDEGNFAEMAQRLEAALRRPSPAKLEPKPEPQPALRPPVRPEPPAGRRPAPLDAAGAPKAGVKAPDSPSPDLKVLQGKGKNESAIDSLEDEMARMLGRPGKS
jgi:flagellar protein FliO/FliZ